MFNGKMKAFTLSYDDGVEQDVKLIELMDKYGIRGTFNLNSGLFGTGERLSAERALKVYEKQEVAAHTLTHPRLNALPDEEIVRQCEGDRLALRRLFGREVTAMAYPYGGESVDARVIGLLRERSGIRLARNVQPSYGFSLPADRLDVRPTIRHRDERLFELAERFLNLEAEEPALFILWGHSYEFERDNNWQLIEELFKMMSNRDDICCATLTELLETK